jgi:hypothetical protein
VTLGAAPACWGDDTHGQSTPAQADARALAAGLNHTCMQRADGYVECWGDDGAGQATPP